jgi:hypothetical protein
LYFVDLYKGGVLMKIVPKSLRSRAARLALLLVVLGSVTGLLSPVQEAQAACAFRPVLRSYYSDATYTTMVGQRGNDCTCNGVFWGVTSSFMKSETLCCPVYTC